MNIEKLTLAMRLAMDTPEYAYEKLLVDIGEEVAERLVLCSRQEVVDRAGVTLADIQRLLMGDHTLPLLTTVRILHYLGLTLRVT